MGARQFVVPKDRADRHEPVSGGADGYADLSAGRQFDGQPSCHCTVRHAVNTFDSGLKESNYAGGQANQAKSEINQQSLQVVYERPQPSPR